MLLCAVQLSAQVTRIRGTVVNADTDEPMPFVNVAIPGTSIGTITSVDGTFFIETRSHVDSLIVSYIGYLPYKTAIHNGSYLELAIRLNPDNIVMDEIVVHPGENPAFRILREINENKTRNNPTRQSLYTYEVYNKMELDINNITEEYKNQKIFKKFQFVSIMSTHRQ